MIRIDVDGDDVAWVTLDQPGKSANSLSLSFLEELEGLLQTMAEEESLRAVVLCSAKEKSFLLGADVAELEGIGTSAEGEALSGRLQRTLRRLEEMGPPVVAAIDGFCLGGGLELALACQGRIATTEAVFALPEVRLGLLPWGGGTQRLPRLMGLSAALVVLLRGKKFYPYKAQKMGLLDQVVEPVFLRQAAKNQALLLAQRGESGRPVLSSRGVWRWSRNLGTLSQGKARQATLAPGVRHLILRKAREEVQRQTQGLYPAPLRLLEVVERGLAQGIEEGYQAEAHHFGLLLQSEASQHLRSLSLAISVLKEAPPAGKGRGRQQLSETKEVNRKRALGRGEEGGEEECSEPKETFAGGEALGWGEVLGPGEVADGGGEAPNPVRRLAIVGAGLMGTGIALAAAQKGIRVRLQDIDEGNLAQGLARCSSYFQRATREQRYPANQARHHLDLISGSSREEGFEKMDLVLEAVFEELELKRRVVARLEEGSPQACILASTTSALPIASIASTTKHPERVVGLHFFSPAEKMPLLELVTTAQTAPEVTARCLRFARDLGKVPLLVRDGAGFYTTRIFAPFLHEGIRILAEGESVDSIDWAMLQFGYAVGPLKLLDEIGIDVGLNVLRGLFLAYGERMSPLQELEGFLAEGRLGRKAGKGFYLYNGSKGKSGRREPDPAIYSLFQGWRHRPLPPETIQRRMVLSLVNEALRCLEEGVLRSAQDGDVGAVLGLGFPPLRGGPFRYVDSEGAATLLRHLESLAEVWGDRFTPCALLRHYAQQNKLFYPA